MEYLPKSCLSFLGILFLAFATTSNCETYPILIKDVEMNSNNKPLEQQISTALNQAQQQMDAENWTEAVAILQNAIAQLGELHGLLPVKEDTDQIISHGDVKLRSGNYQQAAKSYYRALKTRHNLFKEKIAIKQQEESTKKCLASAEALINTEKFDEANAVLINGIQQLGDLYRKNYAPENDLSINLLQAAEKKESEGDISSAVVLRREALKFRYDFFAQRHKRWIVDF